MLPYMFRVCIHMHGETRKMNNTVMRGQTQEDTEGNHHDTAMWPVVWHNRYEQKDTPSSPEARASLHCREALLQTGLVLRPLHHRQEEGM